MSAADIMKSKSRGFSLTEMLIVIMVIGILAGMSMLAFGRQSEKAEATLIMSDLDTVKNAMLAYSMERRTRRSDGLEGWSAAAATAIMASLDKYTDANLGRGRTAPCFAELRVRYVNGVEVGFDGFPASDALRRELDKKVHDEGSAVSGMYSGSASGGDYSLWIRVK
jgi:prepilin-type N-terminal cleavage/methylation domain-containing protein